MIVGQFSGQPLGAIPAIIGTILLSAVKYKWTEAQIGSALAQQYREMQLLQEAEINQLSVSLARQGDRPEWEWFQILSSARDLAMFRDNNGEPPPPPPKPGMSTTMWIALGMVAVVVVMTVTR